MNSIIEYFEQSELSLAAYATLIPGIDPFDALTDNTVGMSAAQADHFARKWTVIDQYTDTSTGFSATVFERDGQRYLAIRGTQPTDVLDLIADIDLASVNGVAAIQTIALYNYVQRLSGVKDQPVGQLEWNGSDYDLNYTTGAVGLLDTPLFGPLTVAGHSLGGHLAMAFGRLFPGTSQIYTYNAPGFIDGLADTLFARIDAALGRANSTYADANTNNLYGSGLNIIAGYANDHGVPYEIFLENNTHSVVDLTDSLAVYNLFATLDTNLNANGITDISNFIKASTDTNAESLEATVDMLGSVFGVAGTVATVGDRDSLRNSLYTQIQAIQASALFESSIGVVSIVDASSLSRFDQSNTIEGDTYRFALVNLTPFAISGNAGLYLSSEWGVESFTEQYLDDRAHMLDRLIEANTADDYLEEVRCMAIERLKEAA